MSIKFNCQHCQRSLKANQELAGKKVRCPGCKQVVTIPTLGPPHPDVEALAAAALAEQSPDEPKELPPIKFACPFCDEEVQVNAELAGKQTPCPECRRIIKVPVQEKSGPKDWRKVDTRRAAAGLLRDEPPPPEGAWGTTGAASAVSRQALVEANAVPTAAEKPGLARRVYRGLLAAAALGLVAVAVLAVLHYRSRGMRQGALDKALALASETSGKLPNVEAAEVHRAAGDYYFRAGAPDKARAQFKQALTRLRTEPAAGKPPAPEKDLLAIDLALSQADLGGSKEEVDQGTRIKWDDVYKDIRPTLLGVGAVEARLDALRRVGRKLMQRGQGQSVETLIAFLGDRGQEAGADRDRAELTARVGLELVADQRQAAEGLAARALQVYAAKPAGEDKEKDKRPQRGAVAVAPALVALLELLGQDKAIRETLRVSSPTPDLRALPPDTRFGYSLARAYQGNWEEARKVAGATGPEVDRLKALLAVAEVAVDRQNTGEARAALETALGLAGKGDPWTQYLFVQAAANAGLADRVQAVADAIPEAGLRARAQAEVTRALLAAAPREPKPDWLDKELAKKDAANPWVLEALARHNASAGGGSAALRSVETWQPETLRPLGYAGVALGLQDGGK